MVDEPKRVCITGLGAVSPYGRSPDDLWAGLSAGRTAIAGVQAFDAAALPTRFGGEARGYAARDDLDPDAAAAMDRRQLMAADAAIQAIVQAAVPISADTVSQIGVALGSELPENHVSTAATVARTIGAAGPVIHVAAGAAGGLMAIGEAAEWVRREECSIAIAGGADTPITREAFDRYASMLSTSGDDPARASRPYDARRDGIVLSEGAAMLVLEDEDVAIRRGAHIFAYIDGYGATFSRAPIVRPAANEYDAGRAMQKALIKWDLTLQGEIDVIFGSAGGNAIDAVEGKAIRRVWGPNTDRLWVTAIKGALGHTLGASGAMNMVAAVYALQAGLIPPTLNLDSPDPDCGDLEVVTGEARRLHGTKAIVNAFGLGHNASVIVSRA